MGLGAINVDVGKITDFLGKTGEVAKGIREAITGKKIKDPAEMARIENDLIELENEALSIIPGVVRAQTEINKMEAQSTSKFIAGWRPFVGWICGIAFGLHFLIFPIANVVIKLLKITFEFPQFDIMVLVNVLMGMLGLGLYRSFEKKWGVQDQH